MTTKERADLAREIHKALEPAETLAYSLFEETGSYRESPEGLILHHIFEALTACNDLAKAESRYQETFCSQCGAEFGPGDTGYSHCSQHRARVAAWGRK